ncbi:hypothetical protein MIND_01271600 [Mycena indigotica]|uniref:Uncharacterized protein n=1 Tax=Mycena indigotica TaxID=2126181 RepID=A0A8H6S2S6_9AGAR|nr:uncharacterized protein MIND_01271600 [Mycena indigotica]KAF7291278.1 hypothetical protein MIND_01271600 [Mycena indigotica]
MCRRIAYEHIPFDCLMLLTLPSVKEPAGPAAACVLLPRFLSPCLCHPQHFQRHLIVAIVDCDRRDCENSQRHRRPCANHTRCIKNFGEQIDRDVDAVDDFCWVCKAAADRRARGLNY